MKIKLNLWVEYMDVTSPAFDGEVSEVTKTIEVDPVFILASGKEFQTIWYNKQIAEAIPDIETLMFSDIQISDESLAELQKMEEEDKPIVTSKRTDIIPELINVWKAFNGSFDQTKKNI